MGYLGATLTQVFTRARSGHVTQRCHNSPDGKRGYRVRVTSRTGSARRILGQLVELRTRHRTRRVNFRGSQRPDKFVRYGRRTRWGGRWKSQNRKNVYLSPYVEEPLNLKVIKSFVPEIRSVFRVLRFLCSMYICYEHSMYVSHICIWLWYIWTSEHHTFRLFSKTGESVIATQRGFYAHFMSEWCSFG